MTISIPSWSTALPSSSFAAQQRQSIAVLITLFSSFCNRFFSAAGLYILQLFNIAFQPGDPVFTAVQHSFAAVRSRFCSCSSQRFSCAVPPGGGNISDRSCFYGKKRKPRSE